MKNAPTSISSKSGRVFLLNSEEDDARIRAGIAADPDTHELTDAELAELRPLARTPGRPKAESTKQPVSIRVDADLLAAMKASGPGWQTRANDALRAAFLKPPGA
ncbi:MAG: BrnA antitoxin family protein [Sphingobacterium sp.]|nr:BrnA antitoxin family protein [Sphingobacterium sp.]